MHCDRMPRPDCQFCGKPTSGPRRKFCSLACYRASDVCGASAKRTLAERFWNKIERLENGCWRWTGVFNQKGYGIVFYEGRQRPAHRISWELAHGEVMPPGIDPHHKCKHRWCVNPDCLIAMPHAENVRADLTVTHCKRGHEYSGDNIRLHVTNGRTWRTCRACDEIRSEEKYANNRENILIQKQQYYIANRTRILAQKREYRKAKMTHS